MLHRDSAAEPDGGEAVEALSGDSAHKLGYINFCSAIPAMPTAATCVEERVRARREEKEPAKAMLQDALQDGPRPAESPGLRAAPPDARQSLWRSRGAHSRHKQVNSTACGHGGGAHARSARWLQDGCKMFWRLGGGGGACKGYAPGSRLSGRRDAPLRHLRPASLVARRPRRGSRKRRRRQRSSGCYGGVVSEPRLNEYVK